MQIIHFFSTFIHEIAAFFGALGMVYFFIHRALNKIKPYTNVVENINALDRKLNNISNEFKNNHGSSLKDQICAIENSVKENTFLTKSIFYRQRWILDNRTEPIFEADQDGNFTWVNDSFIRLVKRSKDDLLNNKWKIIISEENRHDIYCNWEDAIKEKRNFEETIFITDKKGNRYSTICTASLQEDGNYIGTFSEIERLDKEKI